MKHFFYWLFYSTKLINKFTWNSKKTDWLNLLSEENVDEKCDEKNRDNNSQLAEWTRCIAVVGIALITSHVSVMTFYSSAWILGTIPHSTTSESFFIAIHYGKTIVLLSAKDDLQLTFTHCLYAWWTRAVHSLVIHYGFEAFLGVKIRWILWDRLWQLKY